MSKKSGSSIRKKIVRGYIRIYCFIAFVLFLLFTAGSYVTAFYAAQEYVRADIQKALEEITQYKNEGLSLEELYDKSEQIMPGYVLRYDVTESVEKIKEEDYYNTSYYRNLLSSEIEDPIVTIQPTSPTASITDESATKTAGYLEEDLTKGYVTSGYLSLRPDPDIYSGVEHQVSYGTEIYIIEDMGEWSKILYDGRELYAPSKFITTGPQPTATPEQFDEFWREQTKHLFSGKGPDYTTEGSFDINQTGNAIISLKEPYTFYIMTGVSSYDEDDTKDYVERTYYNIKAVVDITDVIPYHVIWSVAAIIFAALMILFFAGMLLVWIYGAAKTRKYLKPINEITRLASEIQPNSQYRLNVETAKFELKELVITINNMLDRLNDAHVKRKKFVSDVSHELRTPISVIAGYANMLKRWAKDDQAVFDESVDAIAEEASNMKYLVENLLFLARSDNDQNVYEMESFDISKLIETICRDADMVDKGKHEITCDVQQGIIVVGDMNRMKQAIREFVQNAVKYTPPMGEIKISLQKNEGKAIINITDTGMGIPQKDMGHIFSRFYRGDASRNRDQGGYGLGLSICREIISAHKGKILFKSKEGSGTRVTVTLNLA